MSTQRFSHTQYPVSGLIDQIDSGDLSLPDLQRPFVWKRSRVRDLFDSLYQGYPAGYFLFWTTPQSVDGHAVGTTGRGNAGLKMIVDGQQRLTSLYSVMKGKAVVSPENELKPIRISFNPLTEEFAVADAARENDPEWLTDISSIWTDARGQWAFTNDFIEQLSKARPTTDQERTRVGTSLGRLASLTNYQFSALELSPELDIEEVADVFVRINSKGVALNSADFILTLMSVHKKEARHQLEDFALDAKQPSATGASPYNHFHAPSPDQLLRVAVGLGLKRGVLQNAYQALRGKDPETKSVSAEVRDKNFKRLLDAQEHVLNLTNWHDYLTAVKRAGYRSGGMLTSANNFLYCYLFFLLGRVEFSVPREALREATARWFFMASLTGRYTGSPETILEADLRRFGECESADDFVDTIDRIVETQLTEDYWAVTLPDLLDSSAAWSPYLFAYHASLNLLDARALFSNMKLKDLFDPGVSQPKSAVERHHLFPKAHLASIGITGTTRTNQIANYAYVEWADNIAISDSEPAEYWPKMVEQVSASDLADQCFWHALPKGWHEMDYYDFLRERRKQIAQVTRAGYELLRDGQPAHSHKPVDDLPSVAELLRQMETNRVEFKKSARVALDNDAPERVINDGVVKTVAAFLNSNGGTLAIGISDGGDVVGIQPDLDYKHQDLDGYENWLTTLFINKIGAAVVGEHVRIRFESVGSEVVCLVDVTPAKSPVFADLSKGDHQFLVRMNNSSRPLVGSEIISYRDSHW